MECSQPEDDGAGALSIDEIAAQSSVAVNAPRATAARGFIGHDLSHKSPQALRAVALQGQSRLASGDPDLAARRLGRYLADVDADLVLVSETGIRDGTARLRQFKATLRSAFKWLAYNHYPAHLPHGKGVMLLTRIEYPPLAKSIARDAQARGITASFSYPARPSTDETDHRTTVTMRAIAGYGVTGWTMRDAAPAENDEFKEWLVGEIHAAADQDMPVIIGMDMNAIENATYDSVGSSVSPRAGSVSEAVFSAGCRCSFRLFFPAMTQTPRGPHWVPSLKI